MALLCSRSRARILPQTEQVQREGSKSETDMLDALDTGEESRCGRAPFQTRSGMYFSLNRLSGHRLRTELSVNYFTDLSFLLRFYQATSSRPADAVLDGGAWSARKTRKYRQIARQLHTQPRERAPSKAPGPLSHGVSVRTSLASILTVPKGCEPAGTDALHDYTGKPSTMLLIDTPVPLKRLPAAAEAPVHNAAPRPARPAPTPARPLAEAVVIESAGVQDWLPICDMVTRSFPLETEQNMGYWLCHQLPYFRVARAEGQVLGFLHAQPRRDTGTLWINLLAVDHRYRNRGIAHRLVKHFDSVARDWGCQAIGLQCLVTNTAAISLYERHGYACQGESITSWGLRVATYRKALRVTAAPPGAPRPPVVLHGRARRIVHRLWYLGWFRHHSPLTRGPAPIT